MRDRSAGTFGGASDDDGAEEEGDDDDDDGEEEEEEEEERELVILPEARNAIEKIVRHLEVIEAAELAAHAEAEAKRLAVEVRTSRIQTEGSGSRRNEFVHFDCRGPTLFTHATLFWRLFPRVHKAKGCTTLLTPFPQQVPANKFPWFGRSGFSLRILCSFRPGA